MARITIDDCLDENDSHFELTFQIARRAREVEKKRASLFGASTDSAIVIALREIAEKKAKGETADETI